MKTELCWNWFFNLILSCLYLFDLKPYIFLFSLVTGISCCGGMHLFGLWHKMHQLLASFTQCVLSSRVYCELVASCFVSFWVNMSLQCLDYHILCLIVMKKLRDRSWYTCMSLANLWANLCEFKEPHDDVSESEFLFRVWKVIDWIFIHADPAKPYTFLPKTVYTADTAVEQQLAKYAAFSMLYDSS